MIGQPVGQAVWVDQQLMPGPRDLYDETTLAAEVRQSAARKLSVAVDIMVESPDE
jgi:hypothetical protein